MTNVRPVPSVRRLVLQLLLLVGLMAPWPARAQEPALADKTRVLAQIAREGVEAAERHDVAAMQAEYEEIHEAWGVFEDEVRESNPTAYVELEGALSSVKEALQAQPLDSAVVQQAYEHLEAEANEVAEKLAGGKGARTEQTDATPTDLVARLDAAHRAVEAGNSAVAAEEVGAIILAWPSVEGAIAAKSPEAYTAIEVDLSRAAGALRAQPADLPTAKATLERLRENLAPFTTAARYTVFDAAAIILREGLEALLVIVALLAFLDRSGNSDKRRWIWMGALVGVLVSFITAFALQALFSRASAGQNREVIEGVTGLIAAGLLFYVSYWLHSKSSLRAWQAYIDARTTKALARGSMVSLALLSFLAVFREGAETTVFYLGMASSIALKDLALGLGMGTAVLVVMAILMLKAGLTLPMRPFFWVASLLVYYLGFKFVGTGIHALQVGGVLPASPVAFVRAIPFIGLYPTWEVVAPQVLLLLVALGVIFYVRAQDRRASATVTAR
ncbi:MAG: FTR1 family protein [Anaerolineae bacterium]